MHLHPNWMPKKPKEGMVSFVKNGDDPDGPWRETFLALNEELDRWDDYQRRLEEWYKAKEVHDLWYMTKLEECTASHWWWPNLHYLWLNEKPSDKARRLGMEKDAQALEVSEPVQGEEKKNPKLARRRTKLRKALDEFGATLAQLDQEGEFWSPEWENKHGSTNSKPGQELGK